MCLFYWRFYVINVTAGLVMQGRDEGTAPRIPAHRGGAAQRKGPGGCPGLG